MNFRHAFVSLAALVGLAACSDEDTIVSLNVTASDAVPVIDTLRVTVTQGSKQHVAEFAPPTETPAGEMPAPPSIKNSFFQRITLPGEWSESEAKVAVEALHANGSPYSPPFSDDTTAVIQPEDVVAAYVQLDVPPEPPPSEGGAGGEGASNGTGGQSTGGQSTGGQSTGGQSTGGQGAGGDGGVGGASAAGAGGG